MQKKKSLLLLLSVIIAAMLILAGAFMLMPKNTAHADTEESGQLTDLYWGLDENTGVLTLSSDSTNPATPNLYSALLVNGDNVPAWFYEKNNINSVTVDTYACAPQSMHMWFFWCENLTSVNLTGLDTSHTTDLGWMFYHCSCLTSLDLFGLDTANVTDMSYMFGSCEALATLNISDFDTSNVIDMSAMFDRCSELKTLDLSSFNTEKVKTMECMFFNCSGLTTLNVSNFNTANVTDMNQMFSGCSKLTSLDLSSFNTANVTDMYQMFFNCSGLTTLNVSNFNTANVTDMNQMFSGCSKLATIDISSFDISNVTDEEEIEKIFLNCDSLKEIKTPKIIGEVALPLPDSEKWWNGTADITTGSITSADAGKTIYRHATCSGGTATCTQKAICVVCGNEYGEALGHSLTHIPENAATEDKQGNKEYWSCDNCNKYFADADGKEEITDKDSVVIPKLTNAQSAPTVNVNTVLWIILVVILCAIILGELAVIAYLAKRNKNASGKDENEITEG